MFPSKNKINIFQNLNLLLISFFIFPFSSNALNISSNDKQLVKEEKDRSIELEYSNYEYVLGIGDNIYIDFTELNEFSNSYSIGPTGTIYLPEIGATYVEGLSIKGLNKKLKNVYSEIIIEPNFNIEILAYRPINVFTTGEFSKPGKYTISGLNDQSYDYKNSNKNSSNLSFDNFTKLNKSGNFPTLFDAIRASGGITLYSDLSRVEVLRRKSKDSGGGYVKTTLNLLPELTGTNLLAKSQNINLLDGDIVKIYKNDSIITDQMVKVMKSNINPNTIVIFLSGQAENRGKIYVPNGSSLNQALASAGGKKLFSGKIEFIRFSNNESVERHIFNYNSNSKPGQKTNPILRDGDIVNVQRSLIGYSTDAISTITRPALGILSLYNIVDVLSDD